MQYKISLLPSSVVFEKFLGVVTDSFTHIQSSLARTNLSGNANLIDCGSVDVRSYLDHQLVKNLRTMIAEHTIFRFTLLKVEWRPNPNATIVLCYKEDESSPFGIVELNVPADHTPVDEVYKVASAISKHFEVLPADIANGVLSERITTHNTQFQAKVLLELQNSVLKLCNDLSEKEGKLSQFLLDKRREMDEIIKAKELELNEEHTKKLAKLSADVEVFEKRKKDLDDRDRTVVQRDILKELKKIINEQQVAKLSTETTQKRRIVEILLWILCGTGVLMFGSSLILLLMHGTADWKPFVTLGTGSIMLVSTLIYYISWSNHWFSEHAQAEFMNRKMHTDTVRAGWIAELCLEWQKEGKDAKDFPPALLAALTQSLYSDPHSTPSPKHPIEQLITTFNDAQELEVGKEGIKLKKK